MMEKIKFRIVFISLCVFTTVFLPTKEPLAQEKITPSEVYSQMLVISRELIEIKNLNEVSRQDIKISANILLNEIQPRHVIQKSIEIEDRLDQLTRLLGHRGKAIEPMPITNVKPSDVLRRANSIIERMQILRKMNGRAGDLEIPPKNFGKRPSNVYAVLTRINIILDLLGTPSTRPSQVCRRAQLISLLLEKFCRDVQCFLPSRTGKIPASKKPREVYIESFKLINLLPTLLEKLNTKIPGGVVAQEIKHGAITPAFVNDNLGTIVADLLAVNAALGKSGSVQLPPLRQAINPTEVWSEISYSVQVARSIITSPTR